MSELGTESLESALGDAFSEPVKQAPAATPPPAKAVRPPEDDEAPLIDPEVDPADLLQAEPEPEAEADTGPDPVFEIEVDGKPEVIQGKERIKEVLARGLKAGRGFEENARVRDALQARYEQVQMQERFNSVVSKEFAALNALNMQLQQYENMDWSAAYDSDPFNALKLKEQRDQLREHRAAAVNSLNAKQQQFEAHIAETGQRQLAAEHEALLAKVPTWRNQEKATQERGKIATALTSHYGFAPAEVGSIMDHRMILVARDAAAYRELLANKDARVKQARTAPATARPGAGAPPTNGRVEFSKVRGKLRELGAKGNHRAQEQLASQLFERAFK